MASPFAGLPLDYLIEVDDAPGTPGRVTEPGYDVERAPLAPWIMYGNLRDQEKNNEFEPYDPAGDHDDIGAPPPRGYGERKPLRGSGGFWRLVDKQIAKALSYHVLPIAIEWDNLDSYDAALAIEVFNRASLLVAVKNPLNVDGDEPALIRHRNAAVAIIEDGAGSVADNVALINQAGRPDFPLRFVFYGGPEMRDKALAFKAEAARYPAYDIGITYSAGDEYGHSEHILLPRRASTPLPPIGPIVMPTVTGADILAKARSYIGKFHDGPDVPMLARAIGQTFPEFAKYCTEASNDMPWCGDFVAYVLSQFGIRPAPVKNGVGFFYVDNWLDFGTPIPVGQEQPGDVILFIYPGSLHHICFYAGNGRYVGGNQSDAVTETSFSARPSAVRRAPVAGAIPAQPVISKPSQQFEKCIPMLLKDEGGNDDDPRDPGGRTSRGILQSEWDRWRQTHPGLPSDVWQAPQDQVIAIYREKYWDAMSCDQLPAGVDYAVFDFGVNSGIGRSAQFLQRIVGAEVDGEIGPETLGKTAAIDARTVINRLCDDRMSFLQGLGTWGTFGRGWTNRVTGVRQNSLAMVGTVLQPNPPGPEIFPPIKTQPQPLPLLALAILFFMERNMPGNQPFDLSKIVAIMSEPVVNKLLTGGAVTLKELLSIPADIRTILTGGTPVQPALPPPTPIADPAPLPPPPAPVPPAATPPQSVLPGLAGGFSISGIIAALMGTGTLGTPFGMGTEPTTMGTLAGILGAISPVIGAAGGWGKALSIGANLFGSLVKAANDRPKTT